MAFTPNCIDWAITLDMYDGMDSRVLKYKDELVSQGWRFFVVNQTRGRCYSYEKVITLPEWIYSKKDINYRNWYISHEMAHAYDMCKHSHGQEFMEWLKKICPYEYIHHELGYKPRNATQAGILFLEL